jgi:hypothetical protein
MRESLLAWPCFFFPGQGLFLWILNAGPPYVSGKEVAIRTTRFMPAEPEHDSVLFFALVIIKLFPVQDHQNSVFLNRQYHAHLVEPLERRLGVDM